MQSDIKSNCLQQAAGAGLLQQAAATAGQTQEWVKFMQKILKQTGINKMFQTWSVQRFLPLQGVMFLFACWKQILVGQRGPKNGSNSCKGVAERLYLEKLALWITRKSTLLNLNSSSMNIRENRARIYVKLLKYSTASRYSEPALRLPFGQNPRHHLCSTRPWGSDTETWVFYEIFILSAWPLEFTVACVGGDGCLSRVPSLALDPIWDFIFRMLLLEPDTCMTIISLSANSWNV